MVALQLCVLLLAGCWAHSLRSWHGDAVLLQARRGDGGDGFDVSGAGDTRVNGRYEAVDGHYDTYAGHPMYRPVDSSGKQIFTAGEIYNQGGQWIIRHEDITGSLYVGEGETPDTAVWAVGPVGTPPVPTVGLAAAPAKAKEPKAAEPKAAEPKAEEPKAEPEPTPVKAEEPSAAPVTAATTTATTTTAAAATTEPLEKDDLVGLGGFVGLRLLIFFIILACITCCLLGLCVVPRDDGDTYTAQIDHSFGHKLGMEFEWRDGGLAVLNIEDEENLAHHFNERHGDASSDPCHIDVGHVLIEVNSVRNDEKKMRAELAKPKPLTLVFRRPRSEETSKNDPWEISDTEDPADPSTPDKRPSVKGGGSTGGSNKSQLDDIMAKRRAREDGEHGDNVGSLASKSNVVDDETAAALARARAQEGKKDLSNIGSQATATSGVHPELAARLADRQRKNEEALG